MATYVYPPAAARAIQRPFRPLEVSSVDESQSYMELDGHYFVSPPNRDVWVGYKMCEGTPVPCLFKNRSAVASMRDLPSVRIHLV